MLNFNRLHIFYHAAKNLNFTAAAGDLFITQPAVTTQIKLLEEYCELKLFRKKGRGVCLTDEGRDLFVRADKTPNIVMETGNTEFIKMEVQCGEGIAFLVESAVLMELEKAF